MITHVRSSISTNNFNYRSADERREIALSVVQKTSPVLNAPTKDRARPPGMVNIKTSFRTEQNEGGAVYEVVPEPDYSPPTSPVDRRLSQPDKQDQSKPHKTTININDNQNVSIEDKSRDIDIYTRVIKTNGEVSPRTETQDKRVSGEYTTNIKIVPGAVNVMPKVNELPKLRKVEPISKKDETQVNPEKSPRDSDSDQKLSVKQIQENIENIYVNEIKEKEDISPRNKTKVPPPPPLSPKVAPPPPLPPLSPVPPPPPCDFRASGGKLKQVHWTRVPKPLVCEFISFLCIGGSRGEEGSRPPMTISVLRSSSMNYFSKDICEIR